jgi:hypothetical protein
MKPKLGKMLEEMKKVKAWQERFEPQAPKRGDLAPDFTLRDVDGDHPVRLSEFRGRRPVALIFGSYT